MNFQRHQTVAATTTPSSYYSHKISQIANINPEERMAHQLGSVVEEVENNPGFWWVSVPGTGRLDVYHEHEMQDAGAKASDSREAFLESRKLAKSSSYGDVPGNLKLGAARGFQAESFNSGIQGVMGAAAAYAASDVMKSMTVHDEQMMSLNSLNMLSKEAMLGFMGLPDEVERGSRRLPKPGVTMGQEISTRSAKGVAPPASGMVRNALPSFARRRMTAKKVLTHEEAFEMAQEELKRKREHKEGTAKKMPPFAIQMEGGRPAIKAQMDEMKKTGGRSTGSGTGLGGAGTLSREDGSEVRRVRKHELPEGEDVIKDRVPMGVELKQLEARLGSLLRRHIDTGSIPEVPLYEGTARQVSRALRKYVADDVFGKLEPAVRQGLLKLSVAFEQVPLFQISSS